MIRQDEAESSWHWVRISTVLLLITIATGIITISAGFFDPKPIGELQHTYQLNPLTVDAESTLTHWLDEPLVEGSGTIRLRAAFVEGEMDSGYGLAMGSDQDRIVIALSPVGYLTIQRWSDNKGETVETSQILPWQTWPHVRTQNKENELWVDFKEGYITTIRINRELLWQEKIPFITDQIGLVTQSFGEQADFNFLSIQHYLHQE